MQIIQARVLNLSRVKDPSALTRSLDYAFAPERPMKKPLSTLEQYFELDAVVSHSLTGSVNRSENYLTDRHLPSLVGFFLFLQLNLLIIIRLDVLLSTPG